MMVDFADLMKLGHRRARSAAAVMLSSTARSDGRMVSAAENDIAFATRRRSLSCRRRPRPRMTDCHSPRAQLNTAGRASCTPKYFYDAILRHLLSFSSRNHYDHFIMNKRRLQTICHARAILAILLGGICRLGSGGMVTADGGPCLSSRGQKAADFCQHAAAGYYGVDSTADDETGRLRQPVSSQRFWACRYHYISSPATVS